MGRSEAGPPPLPRRHCPLTDPRPFAQAVEAAAAVLGKDPDADDEVIGKCKRPVLCTLYDLNATYLDGQWGPAHGIEVEIPVAHLR